MTGGIPFSPRLDLNDFSESCQMRKHTGNVEEKHSCCYPTTEMLLYEDFHVDMLNLGIRKQQQNAPEYEFSSQPYKCIILWRLCW